MPVPEFFPGVTEALASGANWPLFARIFVHGPADSRVIGVFDSRMVASLDAVNQLYRQSVELSRGKNFGLYCHSFGIDRDSVQVGMFLQEIVGSHNTSSRIIAMNNPDGEIIVQMRNIRNATVVYDKDAIRMARFLHQRAIDQLDPGYFYQTEMVGGRDESLFLVQVKPVMPLPHAGIEFRQGISQEAEKEVIDRLTARFPDIRTIPIGLIDPSHLYGMKINDTEDGGSLEPNQPYVLTIKANILKSAHWSFNWGNIVGLILKQELDGGKYLQHGSYRLMRQVWHNGGIVVVQG